VISRKDIGKRKEIPIGLSVGRKDMEKERNPVRDYLSVEIK